MRRPSGGIEYAGRSRQVGKFSFEVDSPTNIEKTLFIYSRPDVDLDPNYSLNFSIEKKQKYRYWEPALIGIAAAIGLLAGYNINFSGSETNWIKIDKEQDVHSSKDGRIEEVLRFIESNYVDTLGIESIEVHMIQEMLEELDPHSSYITADELEEHEEKLEGKYLGIGVETQSIEDTFHISYVNEDSPAQAANLKVGTQILAIDGEAVAGVKKSFKEFRQLLKNRSEEAITLTVKPLGSKDTVEVELTPKELIIGSAEVSYEIEEQTVFLRISRFSSNTYEQFVESIDRLAGKNKPLNLIMDLRDNPGGELSEAIKVLSQLFEESDHLLTYTEGLNRKMSKYHSTGKNFFKFDKIVILIDSYSASASEIIAGAIQDWDMGLVIGSPSYGKGLVQEIFPLKNGGALRLTVAKYYTPSGRCIQKEYEGLTTEHVVESTAKKTMILGRPMDNGTGIKPDLELKNLDSKCILNNYVMESYVLEAMKKKGHSDLVRQDMNLPDFQLLLEKIDVDDSGLDYDLCGDQIIKELYSKYKEMILSRVDYYRYRNVQDKSIKAALDFIKNEKTTMALLSQEK